MEKSCRKCAPKASPKPLFNLAKHPKSHCMQEILLKIRYFDRRLSKTLKNVNFNFSFEHSPFY